MCLWQFADRYGFNHSLKYLELAEQSAARAVSALSAEKLFMILMIVFFVLFAVGVLLTILLARRQKKKKQTMENRLAFCVIHQESLFGEARPLCGMLQTDRGSFLRSQLICV